MAMVAQTLDKYSKSMQILIPASPDPSVFPSSSAPCIGLGGGCSCGGASTACAPGGTEIDE